MLLEELVTLRKDIYREVYKLHVITIDERHSLTRGFVVRVNGKLSSPADLTTSTYGTLAAAKEGARRIVDRRVGELNAYARSSTSKPVETFSRAVSTLQSIVAHCEAVYAQTGQTADATALEDARVELRCSQHFLKLALSGKTSTPPV